MKKVGILTWHYFYNFGSVLQAYALQEAICKIGYDVKIINYRSLKYGKVSKIRSVAKEIMAKICKLNISSYDIFIHKYLKQTKVIQKKRRLLKLNNDFNIFVCGSDQIWAPNVFESVYMLDFVEGTRKKVSYAASIGLNSLPEKYSKESKNLLSDFYAVSVREESGAELLRDKCGINNIDVVLDPTLLLQVDDYFKLEKRVKVKGEYLFCYFLNANHGYEKIVMGYAKTHGLTIVGWSAKKSDKEWMGDFKWIGPSEFLWLIHNAEAIFTDSYHGTIFSLLYHKCFFTFERFDKDDPINQNSRIYQLDKWFDIKDRIVRDGCELAKPEYDYITFEETLKINREQSEGFLKKALQ